MTWHKSRPPLILLLAAGLVLCAVAAASLLESPGEHALGFTVLAGGTGVLVLAAVAALSLRSAMRLETAESQLQQIANLQSSILNSAGPMILVSDLDGNLLSFNAAAERILGYHAQEATSQLKAADLFPPGELERVGERLTAPLGSDMAARQDSGAMQSFVRYVASFPASKVRGFEMQFSRKDGSTFPAMVYLSAVRGPAGEMAGLLAIAVDMTATRRAEAALRESEERYRDIFEHAMEMIATVSPRGRYLYVNPAWQRQFGQSAQQFREMLSFESAFPPELQTEAAALFRRALNGSAVEQVPLKLRNDENAVVEIEASLSCRTDGSRPVSVRCIFRDVTEQRRRERRLALQLAVSQIVGESTLPEDALLRVLASLCVSLGWDFADLWVVDDNQEYIRHRIAWAAPGRPCEEFLRETLNRSFARGEGLPGQIWKMGIPLWVPLLAEESIFPRRRAALYDGLVSGWGIPVRMGNQVIAVIEFFANQRKHEDREMIETVETVCASLGQFIARSAQESRVRELNRQKEFILNSVADGIFGLNVRGEIDFANPAACRLLGAPASALIGRSLHSIVHEHCEQQCATRAAFAAHQPTTGQNVFERRDGSSFPAEYSITPIMEAGTLSGSVVSFHDISQRYALDRLKDEFVSTVSHELRTPLTSIRGALGLLSAGLLGEMSEKASNLLRIAVANSDRLVRLINDILDLERMESGRAPLSFRRCQLHELAQQAVDQMTPMADAGQVALTVESAEVEIEADPDRLLQVFTNLLSNAVKFSAPESTVRVRITACEGGAQVQVIDQGRGIPIEKLETIFDRFQQVDASDSRQKGGTGLGLAICRSIVQQHQGRIWAERNADRGSTFYLFLPLRAASPGIYALQGPQQETVLVCSASASCRTAIAASLRQNGYRAVEAENGEQAVELTSQLRMQAVLLDMALPAMEGWQTLRRLKDNPETADLPVVILSVLPPGGEPAAHSEGWVQKPVADDALIQELARVLGSGSRVLLVEDDEDLAGIIRATFERAGTLMEHARTRRSAIEHCENHPPDLIILDLALPDGDGLQVVEWLRQRRELRRMPLVVYSAREVSDSERRRLGLGPTEFLTKAKVQPQQVEALVQTMLRQLRQTAAPEIGEAVSGLS